VQSTRQHGFHHRLAFMDVHTSVLTGGGGATNGAGRRRPLARPLFKGQEQHAVRSDYGGCLRKRDMQLRTNELALFA